MKAHGKGFLIIHNAVQILLGAVVLALDGVGAEVVSSAVALAAGTRESVHKRHDKKLSLF